MSPFTVQEAFGGSAVTFGANYPGVEIAFKPGALRTHGQSYALSSPLASDREIDGAVDRLKDELEAARAAAKRALKDYKARAAKG
jgi:hypothetical protein